MAMDKLASRRIFLRNSIPVPDFFCLKKNEFSNKIIDKLKMPVVVKPQRQGSSIGLSVVKRKTDLSSAVKAAFKHGPLVLIEKFINGRELTVGILNDKALPVIEIITRCNLYDYSAKYTDKKTKYIVPAEIGRGIRDKAQRLALLAHHSLGCRDFSRVDFRLDDRDNLYVLEVNTIPGLTERSLLPKAAGSARIGFSKLCLMLLDEALKRKKER